jgi:hydrogenase expression/formation protein HypC
MCYAIPAKVLETIGDTAVVDYGGIRKEVNISLVDGISIGDYLLVHAGFAIEILERDAAKKALQAISSGLDRMKDKS